MSSYFGDCFASFEHVLLANSYIGQNGNDAIELFEIGQVIETFGEIDYEGGSVLEWDYIDSWAYKVEELWTFGGPSCSVGSQNTSSSACPYPTCVSSPAQSQQIISISAGWNIISTYIAPENPAIDELLNPLADNLIIAKDYLGNAYLPQWGFNGIGTIQMGQGYYVKTNTATTLSLIGEYIQPAENPINIINGWNVIGYLRTESYPLDTIFEPLVELGFIIIIKDYLGAAYLPEWGYNGIGDMNPGQGYQIKTNGDCVLQY